MIADVADIRARCEAATAGEWLVHPFTAHIVPAADLDVPICAMLWPTEDRSEDETLANAEFLAKAKTDVLALLTTIATLTAECERLRAALEPFAALAPHFTPGRGTRPSADEHIVMELASGNLPQASITVGDLRRARALQPAAATGGEGT